MCVNDLFQFGAVAVHTVPESFLFGMVWTYNRRLPPFTAPWLAQLEERRSAEREVTGSNFSDKDEKP